MYLEDEEVDPTPFQSSHKGQNLIPPPSDTSCYAQTVDPSESCRSSMMLTPANPSVSIEIKRPSNPTTSAPMKTQDAGKDSDIPDSATLETLLMLWGESIAMEPKRMRSQQEQERLENEREIDSLKCDLLRVQEGCYFGFGRSSPKP